MRRPAFVDETPPVRLLGGAGSAPGGGGRRGQGVVVEVQDAPERALSDGARRLKFAAGILGEIAGDR